MSYDAVMKLILDMGISPKIIPWLEQLGHEAIHIESLNPRALDSEILELAQARRAIVLTSDKDFGALLASRKLTSPSVILFRLIPAPPDEVQRRLKPVLEQYADELAQGCLILIALGKPRLKKLPIRA